MIKYKTLGIYALILIGIFTGMYLFFFMTNSIGVTRFDHILWDVTRIWTVIAVLFIISRVFVFYKYHKRRMTSTATNKEELENNDTE